MTIPFSFFGKNNPAVVKERAQLEQKATQQQKQEHNPMNMQAPAPSAISGHSASEANDLMSLAMHPDNTLTLKSSANNSEDLVVKSH